ncbi:putative nuclease HARBI1 isoform X2 [Eupeodes corollae]|uniref:putative nuclease HARBI1 isoform X2 n=1 Tax=Eupeodes corollae TaxID=290404 RepID=UPI002493C1C3|nr:putative nuclease HARBI1 isoform X2 [Eupeodes corollae]
MDDGTKELLDSSSSSDESDDDSIFEEFFISGLTSDESGAENQDQDDDIDDITSIMDTIDEYSDEDFKSHLGLNRSTVELLIRNYSETDIKKTLQHREKTKLEPRTEFIIYLWYMSNTMTLKQLANQFVIAKTTVWTAVELVSNWLVSQGNLYIKWPQGDAVTETRKKFECINNLPGVIGAIDATHITIPPPKRHKESYYNRKQKFSLVLQGVVDADQKFIDICCGEPGSLDDSSVLKRSALYKRAQTNYFRLFPSNTYLLGDSAYAPSKWLVPPFRNYDQLTDQQKSFNYLHSSTRIVVENTLGLLKERFKRLSVFTEQQDLSSLRKIIVSACVLHNFCIIHDDRYTLMNEKENPDLPSVAVEENHPNIQTSNFNRRQILFNYLCQKNVI